MRSKKLVVLFVLVYLLSLASYASASGSVGSPAAPSSNAPSGSIAYQANNASDALSYFSQISDQVWMQIKQFRQEENQAKADDLLQQWRACREQVIQYLAQFPTSQDSDTSSVNKNSIVFTYDPDNNLLSASITGPVTPALKTLTLSGMIPALTAGGTAFDLGNLSLAGLDQYGNPYSLSGASVTWAVYDGASLASIAPGKSALTPLSAGSGSVTATVYGITSNLLGFTVNTAPSPETPAALKTLTLSGMIPALTAGGTAFDLGNLSLTGLDQYGNPYSLSGASVTWAVYDGASLASIAPGKSALTPLSAGSGSVTATVYGITSNLLGFTIGAA